MLQVSFLELHCLLEWPLGAVGFSTESGHIYHQSPEVYIIAFADLQTEAFRAHSLQEFPEGLKTGTNTFPDILHISQYRFLENLI